MPERVRPVRRPGLQGDMDAGKVALAAFIDMLCHQRVVKYQLVIIAAVVVGGFWRGFGPGQWVSVVILGGWAVYAEMNNTVHEAGGDAISTEYHSGVGNLKNKAAGTVVVVAIVFVICLAILFGSSPGW